MNPQIIKDRLAEIQENVRILKKLQKRKKEKFCATPELYKLAERCLQLAIECVIDVTNYLISQHGWTRPLYHAEGLFILAQHRVFPVSFARKIAGMVDFRNILVHRYLQIDRGIVYDNIRELSDFDEFEKYLLKYLARQEKASKKPSNRNKST